MLTENEIRHLTMRFWTLENLNDDNVIVTDVEAVRASYRAEIEILDPAVEELLVNLAAIDSETSEDVMVVFYDVGKKYFGIEKVQLFRFFALLYMAIFDTTHGPRFGNFSQFFGRENFIQMIRRQYDLAKVQI